MFGIGSKDDPLGYTLPCPQTKRHGNMSSITDDRGYNQVYKPSLSLKIRTERRCDYIAGKMGKVKDARVLEIGCGTGEMSYLLAKKTGHTVVGADLCLPFIENARAHYRLENLRYERLDFSDPGDISRVLGNDGLDFVVGNGILHHLYYRLQDSLKNIHRLLKDGGKMVFLEPNLVNPYCFLIFRFPYFRRLAKLEPSEMAFTKGYISRELEMAGYRDIEVEYRDFLLPNTPDFLIRPVILLGAAAEKTPLLRNMSQSIYISASKGR